MKKTMAITLIALALIPMEGSSHHSVQSAPRSPQTLNIILGGPFVFVRQSNCLNNNEDCIAVWIPDVASHSKPILFGFEGQFYELERMPADYTLTGMTPSKSSGYNFICPVKGASSWVIPGKTLHIPPAPKKKAYLILKLPIPKEIAPWNADPLEPSVTSPAPYTPGKGQSFATMTILRYDYDDSKPLVLNSPPVNGSKGLDLNLEAPGVGSERVLVIQVIPRKPDPTGDEHKHSREAYNKLAATLGLKGTLNFPTLPSGYKRNVPLVPNVLPDDLLRFINTSVTVNRGRINDCKAMAVFVDATK